MNAPPPPIIDRIKALLRLARDQAASPAEAATALERALRLLRQHQIDAATLDLDAETEKLIDERVRVGARISAIRWHVLVIIQSRMRVNVCTVRPDIAFIGLQSDVAFAIYAFEFLVGACSRSVRDYEKKERAARRRVNKAKRESFVRGWTYAVARLLAETDSQPLADSPAAIVLADQTRARQDFFKSRFPDSAGVKRKAPPRILSALEQGWAAGKETRLHRPLGGAESETLRLV